MDLYNSTKLAFRRKVLVFAGAKINISEPGSGQELGFIKMKAFKLKEDIRIFSDSNMTTELLTIRARKVIDFGATYDVIDPTNQGHLFSLKREGMASTFVRDRWNVLDTAGNIVAQVEETGGIALARRYINVIPIIGGIVDMVFWFKKQHYSIVSYQQGQEINAGQITRQKNPFVIKFESDTTAAQVRLDGRIYVAIGAMLSTIEGAKN